MAAGGVRDNSVDAFETDADRGGGEVPRRTQPGQQ